MAITAKNHVNYLLSVVKGITLIVVIIMPCDVYAQTLGSIAEEKTSGFSAPFIKVGHDPIAIAVNPDTNKVYIANFVSNTVSVIDVNSMHVIDIPVGASPAYLAVNQGTNTIYVANYHNNSVSIIDGKTDTKIKDIPVGEHPRVIAIDPFEEWVYVANTGNNLYVDVIDANTDTYLRRINLGYSDGGIQFIAVDPENGQLAASTLNSVYVFKGTGTRNSIANITGDASGIAFVHTGELYIANTNGSVSIIDSHYSYLTNNTSISKIKNVPLGQEYSSSPVSIAVNPNTGQTYLTHYHNNSVSIIDGKTDTKIKDIPVEQPTSLAVNPYTNRTYIVGHNPIYIDGKFNKLIEGISVIDAKSNRLIETVQMGSGLPSERTQDAVAINPNTNTVYVADRTSDAIFVLDGSTNKLAAGITFNVNPTNSGHITCDNMEFPTYQYLYVDFHTQCQAEPNKGFQFVSWVENLGPKSSRSENTSRISDSPLNYFLSIFRINPKDPSSVFAVTKFGNFTANFKEVPPPIPPEYLLALFGLTISIIIPSVLHWINAWRQRRNLNRFIRKLDSVDNKSDAERKIMDLYLGGKINESHHAMLKDMIASKFKVRRDSRL